MPSSADPASQLALVLDKAVPELPLAPLVSPNDGAHWYVYGTDDEHYVLAQARVRRKLEETKGVRELATPLLPGSPSA